MSKQPFYIGQKVVCVEDEVKAGETAESEIKVIKSRVYEIETIKLDFDTTAKTTKDWFVRLVGIPGGYIHLWFAPYNPPRIQYVRVAEEVVKLTEETCLS